MWKKGSHAAILMLRVLVLKSNFITGLGGIVKVPGVSCVLDGVPHADLNNYLYSVLSFLSGMFRHGLCKR